MNKEFTSYDELSVDIYTNENNIKENKRGFRKAINKVTLLVLLLFLIALIASIVTIIISFVVLFIGSDPTINLSDPTFLTNDSLLMTMNMFLPPFISLVTGIFISKALFKIKFRDLFLGKEKLTLYSINGSLACVGFGSIGLLFTLLITSFFGLFNLKATMPDLSIPSNLSLTIISVIYICLIGPIFEEIIFRGFILKATKPLGTGFAIVFSAILFGVFHSNLLQLFPATLMGVLLAYITIKTNSIIPSIIAHIFNNSFRYLEEYIVTSGIISDKFSNTLAIVITILTILIAVFLTLKYKGEIKDIKNNQCLYPISTFKKYIYSFISVPFIICLIYFIINCISLFVVI